MNALLLYGLLVSAEPALRAQPFDPILPAPLVPVVEAAIEAELDAKRGPGNAVALLEEERKKLTARGEEALARALLIRAGTIKLRDRFLTAQEFDPKVRWMQALATYAKLEIEEPGLGRWIDRVKEKVPEAKAALKQGKARSVSAALLLRGNELARAEIRGVLDRGFGKVGFQFAEQPVEKADFALTISAEDAPGDGQRGARVTIGIEQSRDGKVVWRTGTFRVERAADSKQALARALEGALRVAAREVLLRHLGGHGLPFLLDPSPKGMGGDFGEHAGHEH